MEPPPHRRRAPVKLTRPERFELPTLWFEARCSIQLSYGRNPPLADGFLFVLFRILFWNKIRTTTNEIRKFCESKILCEEWDSNPHGLPHRILSPARIPIPPSSQQKK